MKKMKDEAYYAACCDRHKKVLDSLKKGIHGWMAET